MAPPAIAEPGTPGHFREEESAGDTTRVEERGRKNKSGAIGEPGLAGRHFCAMSVPMEKRKARDHEHTCKQRNARRGGKEKTENQDRTQNALLDKRERYPRHAQRAADCHHTDERSGHRPKRTPPKLHRPNTHGDHGQNVVDSG